MISPWQDFQQNESAQRTKMMEYWQLALVSFPPSTFLADTSVSWTRNLKSVLLCIVEVISTFIDFHSKLGTRNLIPDSTREHQHRGYSANLYSIVIFPHLHIAMTILCLPLQTLFQRYLSPYQRKKETSSNFTTTCSRKWHIIGIKFIPIILFLFLLVS